MKKEEKLEYIMADITKINQMKIPITFFDTYYYNMYFDKRTERN